MFIYVTLLDNVTVVVMQEVEIIENKEASFETRKQIAFSIIGKIEKYLRKKGFTIKEKRYQPSGIGIFPRVQLYSSKKYKIRNKETKKSIEIELRLWSLKGTMDTLIEYYNNQVKRLVKLIDIADRVFNEDEIDYIEINDDTVVLNFFNMLYEDIKRIIRKVRKYTAYVSLNGYIIL